MVIREIRKNRYEPLCKALLQRAQLEPLSASFSVTMRIDDEELVLRLQPDSHQRLVILQALLIERREGIPRTTLITDGPSLGAYLGILIEQTLRHCRAS